MTTSGKTLFLFVTQRVLVVSQIPPKALIAIYYQKTSAYFFVTQRVLVVL